MPVEKSAVEFRGNPREFIKQTAIVVIVLGPLTAISVLGTVGFRLFLVSLAMIAPIVGVIYLLLARWDRFSFEDDQSQFRLAHRRPVPYSRIRALRIVRAGSLFQLEAETGKFRRSRLLSVGDASEYDRVVRELKSHFPDFPLRVRRVPVYPLLGGMALLVLGSYGAFAVHLRANQPAILAECQPADWRRGRSRTAYGRMNRLEQVEFALPAILQQVEGGPEGYIFVEESGDTMVSVQPGLLYGLFEPAKNKNWFTWDSETGRLKPGPIMTVLGLSDSSDLLEFVYCACRPRASGAKSGFGFRSRHAWPSRGLLQNQREKLPRPRHVGLRA